MLAYPGGVLVHMRAKRRADSPGGASICAWRVRVEGEESARPDARYGRGGSGHGRAAR
jgi:hypothetical protein